MSRIAWSRCSGEEIESVVAMFISGDYPVAERITPSKGDGGIDVLVKTDRTLVYQVKKFTGPLTSSQKAQIEGSIDSLRTDPRVKDLQVDEWHLVMPWDATLETKKWVTDYATERGLPEPVWDGLTRCDLWASKYPYIVDYYLEGNSERIREMALSFVQGAGLKNIRDEDIENRNIADFSDQLRETVAILNREDPFYGYGIHVEPQFKIPDKEDVSRALRQVKPGVIVSTIMSDGRISVQVDVYAKNTVAMQLNPLKFQVRMTAKPESKEATAIQNFKKFGTPLELPSGVSGSSTLPGGLGGEFDNASVVVFPTSDVPEEDLELRLVIFDPEDRQIDSLVLHREYTTTGISADDQGPRGVESRLTDDHGILEVLFRLDVDEQTQGTTITVRDPQGRLAIDVLPVLRFYQKFRAPNASAIAPRFGPIPEHRDQLLAREGSIADLWVDVAEALKLIQNHTTRRLRFPDLHQVEERSIHALLRAGRLLQGQTLTESVTHAATPHDPTISEEIQTITLFAPWKIEFEDWSVDLGYLVNAFSGSLDERDQELESGRWDIWNVDEGNVVVRAASAEELKALPDMPVLGNES